MTDSIHLNPVHPSILVICSDYSHRHLVTSLGRRIPQVSAQWISQEVDCKGSKYRCACRISCLFPVFAQSSAEHQDFQPSVSGKADSLHIVGLLRKHVLLSHRNLIFFTVWSNTSPSLSSTLFSCLFLTPGISYSLPCWSQLLICWDSRHVSQLHFSFP